MGQKGFTLLEILAVLFIVGISASIVLPNLTNSFEVTKAQTATTNLLAIIAAQERYFEDSVAPQAYCVTAANGGNDCDTSTSALFVALKLGSPDTFNYSCSIPNVAETIDYNCTATDGTDTLTLDPNLATPITCAGPAGKCPS